MVHRKVACVGFTTTCAVSCALDTDDDIAGEVIRLYEVKIICQHLIIGFQVTVKNVGDAFWDTV